MQITAITPQKHDPDRCNIEVDGRFFCGMQLFTVMERRLKVGSAVTDDPSPSNPGSVSTYLAVTCQSADGINSILNTLDLSGVYAVFFCTPSRIARLRRSRLRSTTKLGVSIEFSGSPA